LTLEQKDVQSHHNKFYPAFSFMRLMPDGGQVNADDP